MKYSFSWAQISAFRLQQHHLSRERHTELTAVCQNVCGFQAQLMSAAELSAWARMQNITRQDIRSALLERRTLVKTSCMRQTLHLIPAADFSIYINALKKSRLEAIWKILSRFGITQKEADSLNEMIRAALADGPKNRSELTAYITPKVGNKIKAFMSKAWSIQIFRQALVEGLICYGPIRDNRETFILVDHWLPEPKYLPEREAQQILLRRYLSAYGPATCGDFCRWSGIPMKDAKQIWNSLHEELTEISVGEQSGFILQEDYKKLTEAIPGKPVVCLLPHFDPYLLGHAEKDHLVDSKYYKRVYRNQGWISPVVLRNGKAIGVWSHNRRGKRAIVEIEPFEKFSNQIRNQIEKEVARLGNFLETSREINWVS